MKLSRFIARHSIAIIVVCCALAVPAVWGYFATRVNYDILTYLPQDLDSMRGEIVLDRDYHDAALSFLIVEGMEARDVAKLAGDIRGVAGVREVIGATDVIAPTIPLAMLPDGIRDRLFPGNATILLVKYDGSAADERTQEAIGTIRGIAGRSCFLSGASALLKDTKALVDKETPLYVLLAVVFSVVVLSLTMESFLVPLVFLLEIGVAVLYNFGSNILLGQISYITKALAAVLQLGVTMDFSIFLYNRYEEERERYPDHREAMAQAVRSTFLTISGGALTEMAGFLSLCAMALTLGKDIGIVMAKGVFIGLLCTMTLLPSLILVLDAPLHRLHHRSLLPTFSRGTDFVTRHPVVVSILFVLAFLPAVYGHFNVQKYYNLADSIPTNLDSMVAMGKLRDEFKMTSTHFILVHDTLPQPRARKLADDIGKVDGVDAVLSYDSLVGPLLPAEALPGSVGGIFRQGGWSLIIANSLYKPSTSAENKQVAAIEKLVKEADGHALVTGEGVLTKDLIRIADEDFKRVDWVSIVAIFLIIALIFGSLSVPVLMVSAIELSIFLNVAFSFFIGESIPFIASIVIGCIQLGVTIDYAILLVTRFREEMRRGAPAAEAMRVAARLSSRSIVTSGLTLFAATFGVGIISQMAILRTLCMMIARGALISMLIILFVMPATFVLFDKVVAATSLNWKKGATGK